MSANPNRGDWEAATSPLFEGNRVLESIARHEGLRALLTFSSLHEQIRGRRRASGRGSERDLFETERFILDEVLQLICDRARALTQADGVVLALADGSAMVCRSAAGTLAVEPGVHLFESEFLRECLHSGRILRCDDCQIDARVARDFARQLGARSSVLIPLRGRREPLGVLQAFSGTPRAFTDQDIRCFDLFAELVLSALRPEDQDRRISWLSDVAEEVLRAKPAETGPAVQIAEELIETAGSAPGALTREPIRNNLTAPINPGPSPSLSNWNFSANSVAEGAAMDTAEIQPLDITPSAGVSAALLDLPGCDRAHEEVYGKELDAQELDTEELGAEEAETFTLPDTRTPPSLPFLQGLSLGGSSHPGLSAVIALVAIAALFSAGAWWGMRQGKKPPARAVAANTAIRPQSATTATAPPADVLSLELSDNLMNPEKPGSDATPLTTAAASNLAALPKVTGVRHWSSATGSTVVIDMDDQVPYEVHRLMSPERIYFDLHDTVLSPDLNGKTMDVGDVSLTRVRIGQLDAGVTRIVLDTKGGSNFSVSMESSPYRLVVELRGKEATLAANSIAPTQFAPSQIVPKQMATSAVATPEPAKAAPVAALAAKASEPPLPARTLPVRTGKFRIVLDAGHGGWDLGTVGRQGLLEKVLVLDVTERLGKLLQTRLGSEVMFTRTGDTYLPLDQRAEIANEAQADLFVSVHANYSNSATARGVETYYTNLFSAPGSREVEKHDDGTFARLTTVSLSADGLHEKIEESRRLAASVQRSLYATLAAKSPDIRNRGIKDSAFAVLTGTTMPSILTEISFVSSPADEHNLQTAAYRQQIAEALYQGIARYQQSSPRAKVAQLQTVRH
jgi:N-acetylmuramoyl-L-alanine amidase